MVSENDVVDSVPPPQPEKVVVERLFRRTKSVYEILGGGQIADVLLWRKWNISAAILSAASIAWILFEWSGYTLLTLLANTALILVSAIFVWAQAAHFLKRPAPPLPELALSEEIVQWTAQVLRKEVNGALAVAHSVALGKDFFLFGKVVLSLYLLAIVGGWFNTLSMFFFGVLLSFSLPVFYEKYEDQVDAQAKRAIDQLHSVYVSAEGKTRDMVRKVRELDMFKKKTQ